MPTAIEVIKKLRDQGDMDIGDGVILPLDWPANNWVQYRKREHVGSGNDEVYYEVQNRNNKLVAQLHYKCSEGADSEMLMQLLEKVKDLNFYGYERYRHREMGYLFSCRKPIDVADCDVNKILDKLRDDIKVLYGAFEGIIAKYDSQCHTVTRNVERIKKRSDNKKPSDKKWFVNYKYDTSACDDRYDDELKAISGLTWLPWVGKGYCNTGILVVGESNYTDDGMAEIVESDPLFTRKVSDYFCISELEKTQGQAMPNMARRLMTSVHDMVPKVWSQIAFMDICQKCLIKGKDRAPTPNNFKSGVLPVCSVVDVLRPKFVIFVSKSSLGYFRQCLSNLKDYRILTYATAPTETIGILHTKRCDVPVAFTTHPSCFGANSHIKWRKFLKSHFQDIVPYCKDIVTD